MSWLLLGGLFSCAIRADFLALFGDTPCGLWSRPTLGGTYLGRQSATFGFCLVCLGVQRIATGIGSGPIWGLVSSLWP
jgi:hypothetical protein